MQKPSDILTLQESYQRAEKLIQSADALIIAAGAGMGVDSGLPDFRGNQGFWQAYPALAQARLDFTEVANPLAFIEHPRLAWGFYGHRLGLYRSTVPHPGFAILAQWAAVLPLGHWVFTSNVDGQFQKAGFAQSNLHECHGSIHYLQCLNGCDAVWSAEPFLPDVDALSCQIRNDMPICVRCGGLARPNILMFEDRNWLEARSNVQQQAQQRWLAQLRSNSQVVLVEIGAGTAIPSVRYFSQCMSEQYGARIIRINPREPEVANSWDVGIASGALDALAGIDDALKGMRADLKPAKP